MERVLIVTRAVPEHPSSGGMEQVTMDLAAALSDNADVTVLTTPVPGLPAQWGHGDVRVQTVRGARSGEYSLRWWFMTARHRGLAGYDRVVSASAGAMSMLLLRRIRESVLMVHGAPSTWHLRAALASRTPRGVLRALKYAAWTLLDLGMYVRADRVEVASERLEELLRGWPYGLAWRRTELSVVPHPVDLDYFAPSAAARARARRRLGVDGPGAVLSVVSRLEWLKGADRAVAVMAELPEGSRLLIAGDGDQRQRLEAQAAQLGVASRVTFLGKVSRELVRDVYHASDVFLFPVRSAGREGLPLTVLESVSAGVQVVVPEEFDWPSDVASQVTSVDVSDPVAFSRTVRELVEGFSAPSTVD